ncbi:MAG TPA: SIMPL domain-containing protein [Methanoregulaceae archaeon]|nr:SIMPL domain-containing protein [Methanoregulaceae archaeon]
MKEESQRVLMGLAIVAILAVVFFGSAAGAASTDSSQSSVITSTATGELLVNPDQVEISVAVQTQNPDVKIAQSDNARIMSQVMGALTNAGIPDDKLKTSGYSIYPVYNDNTNPFAQNIKYYQVTNTLVITLNDTSKTGDIIDLCVANGANEVNSVAFSLTPETEQYYRSQALTKAVQQTRADADATAAAMGVNITGVHDAVIGSSLPPVVYDTTLLSKSFAAGAVPAPTTPVSPGQLTVSASVTVSYLFA